MDFGPAPSGASRNDSKSGDALGAIPLLKKQYRCAFRVCCAGIAPSSKRDGLPDQGPAMTNKNPGVSPDFAIV